MATTQQPGIADFYEHDVLPALTERLDQAFPEFGWQRDARGWHASNQEFGHATLGVRADRVVCGGPAPRGFLIHGDRPVLWTTYANGGRPARGREFMDVVHDLAERAGIDPAPLRRAPTPADRKARLLHDAFVIGRHELASDRGRAARSYLEQRGIPTERIAHTTLGLVPPADELRTALRRHGYTTDELHASGISPTPAGPAASPAPGATNTAASSRSGHAPSTPTIRTATSTSAGPTVPTRSRTGSPTSSPRKQRTTQRISRWSKATSTPTSSAPTTSTTSPRSAAPPSPSATSNSSSTSASTASSWPSTTTPPAAPPSSAPPTKAPTPTAHPASGSSTPTSTTPPRILATSSAGAAPTPGRRRPSPRSAPSPGAPSTSPAQSPAPTTNSRGAPASTTPKHGSPPSPPRHRTNRRARHRQPHAQASIATPSA